MNAETVPRRVFSLAASAEQAVREIADALEDLPLSGLLFFSCATHDREDLARALRSRFTCPLVGCSTSGEILSGPGYLEHSLVAVGFPQNSYTLTPVLLPDLDDPLPLVEHVRSSLETMNPEAQRFGLLLVDGLSDKEDTLIATLKHLMGTLPLVGGSAGDGLAFRETFVFAEGAFHRNAAVITFFETARDVMPFCFQHFAPGNRKLVITSADSRLRLVREINGRPAAEVYAEAVGVDAASLNAAVFAANPVLLRIGGEYYVRSIQRVHESDSLKFYCAIEEGLVLTLAQPGDLVAHLTRSLASLDAAFEDLDLILGFDCILRRLELRGHGALREASACLDGFPFLGFSTYGEQFESVHMNHTLSGIAIGRKR